MKKYILALLLVTLIIPSFALASWWNPFSWKIFNRKAQTSQVAPAEVLVNRTQEGSLVEIVEELPKEEIKKITPTTENKIVEKKKVVDMPNTAKDLPLGVDCGRAIDGILGETQPSIECFFMKIPNCSSARIVLGKEKNGSGYSKDVLVSMEKVDDSCVFKTEDDTTTVSCKVKIKKTEAEIKKLLEEAKVASSSDKFLAVYGIPIVFGDMAHKGSKDCTLVKK